MQEEILAMAKELGHVDEGDAGALALLCVAAEQELAAELRAGISAEDCGPAFVLAAAWMALGDLTSGAEGGVASFSVGGVHIQERTGAAEKGGQILRAQARRVMAPYVRDRGFCFCGVRG